ncbi:hypothetical protein Back11_08240 [Paenibacillus baekrokdamisoli]|uniref:Uncharacterized protein n=1 Tax=Paenibacillus baekrokdamisoli TaxID=1712516 RepID=A0A3G9J8V5_9BACL|nr:hypothetical protein [Paenibacillus baekrokdamisoli]MBB3067334.1 ABC-type uncharacterized transport system ATPase subunit [Paenibacillus baekrokdamisoli]BBH19479.1 hypothetical protein Back11_08240 [Paenibacillus baekrokdamisoli]
MEHIDYVKLKDVSLTCKPSELIFPSWMDNLDSFSHEFETGKVYAVVSEPGYGGWALSYLLSGKTKGFTGDIYINDTRITSDSLSSYGGWYLGEGVTRKKNIFGFKRELTVREQIECAPSNQYSLEELIQLFDLSLTRIERAFRYISNERWNASTAIGLIYGKQIFCFPYIKDDVKDIIWYRLKYNSAIIKQHKGITIIPVQSASIVEEFVDEIIYLT